MMDPLVTELIAAIVKSGPGYMLAAYLWLRYDSELKDRRRCDDEMRTLLLRLKDEAQQQSLDSNSRQTDVFSKVAEAVTSHTAQIAELRTDFRGLRCKGGTP